MAMSVFGSLVTFFDSSFFVALVGFVAIYLYFKQKADGKRGAARLILQEIRYAEQQIRNSDRGKRGYELSSKLLPTNSWNDNIHLFTNDLKETEIDMISGFYSKATYIDYLILERSRQRLHPKVLLSPQPASPIPSSSSGTAQPIQPGISVPPQPTQQQAVQVPTIDELVTIQILNEVSSSVEFLYNTPAAEKLRKISDGRWFYIF
jgi:hypothetical protein